MNDMAKVIQTDAGQAVELPEGFRFDADEVHVRREGDCVVLEPADFDSRIDEETGLTMGALRVLIQEGLDSGPGELWDAEAIKLAGRERMRWAG